MACFIEPVLRLHDRQQFEVHCFYNHPTGDELTRRLAARADHWHDIAELDDESVAQRIRDNGIDLLIDLSGHTVGNRMGVFARKPAPLQFTWLGYLCTTGLATMDYRICDAYTDPLGAPGGPEAEKLARLPHSQWCYQPQAELPLASTLPMLRNGFLTLGSFNHEIKLNEAVIRAWMELLQAVPASRLRIFGVTTDILERRIRDACRALDIAGERVEVCGRVEIERYFALYGEVDVALDTFPFNGGTTTCDALIMGVPTVAVAGARALARGGVSLLSNIGLTNWIADSPREIVDVVKAQIADPHALAQLRAELPARMRASPLMDAPRFTQDLEALYRSAWQQLGAA
jgi:predicted O-linked N-acetylglucosamine transferase (SPINDLY family)